MHPTIPLNLESESHATTGTTSSLEISHTSTAVNINMESTKLCRHWTNRFDIGSVNFPPCELCIHGDRDTDIEEEAEGVNEGPPTIMLKEGIVVKEGILVKESVLVKEGFNPIEIKEAVNPVPHPASSLSSPLLTEKNESMNSELMNLEPTSPSDAANITPPATVHLPEMGVFEVPTPPKIAAQRAIRRYHQASTTFPDILSNSSTLLVHTWDTSSPPLHLHASMFHYYLLKLEIVNDTVIFPTACFEAAGLLLRYFYNIGVVEKEVIDAAPLFVLMELAVLAGRLKTVQLLKSLLPVLTQRVKTAGVEELAKYTRTKLEFDADMAKEGISGNRFPGTVECWLANEGRLRMAVMANEGEEYLLEVMKEHPKFALELLDGFLSMKPSRKRKKRVSFV